MTFENRGKIYNNITETIGATPLVRLNRLPEQYGVLAEILLKLEFLSTKLFLTASGLIMHKVFSNISPSPLSKELE